MQSCDDLINMGSGGNAKIDEQIWSRLEDECLNPN